MQENFLSFVDIIMFSRLGLLIIIVGRLIQLNYSRTGKKEIQNGFLLLQAIGIFLLVIGSFASGETLLGFLDLLSAGGAFWLYMKIKK
ncbi:MAG: hypothetical protein WC875_03750 [Candidatus Absconditabacterales bacterium]